MGRLRDLKKATEAYWGDKISREDLLKEGKRLRLEHWKIQKDAGVDVIPSNDFSYYDQVLDHIQLFGVRAVLTALCSTTIASGLPHVLTGPRRWFPRDTPSTTSTPLTNTSLWEEVCRSLPRMTSPLLTSRLW